ncbi:MAG: hypothetical protein ACLRWQ_19555 [Flavonifractor plautii]
MVIQARRGNQPHPPDPFAHLRTAPSLATEVAGAALATVLGQVVGMVVGLCMVRAAPSCLPSGGFRPDSAIIRTMFPVGVPAILVQALATVMNLGMNLILPLFIFASGVFILGPISSFSPSSSCRSTA